MRTVLRVTAMLAVVSVWGYFVGALQNRPVANPLLVTAQASPTSLTPEGPPPMLPRITPSKKIHVGSVYRANCAQCHAMPQKLPAQMIATVMRHMRTQAKLTQDETRTMLAYLIE